MTLTDWRTQDWIFVLRALCFYATSEATIETEYEYTHEIADTITQQEGSSASELLL